MSRNVVTIVLLVFGLTGPLSIGRGQELPLPLREVFKGPGYSELLDLFGEWNAKKLRLAKEEFSKTFTDSIEKIASDYKKPDSWKRSILRLWERTPVTVEPRLPLDVSAQLLLLALYEENNRAFVGTYTKQEGRRHFLTAKLYLILFLAQETATKEEKRVIGASHIFLAIRAGWTGWWPFCVRNAPLRLPLPRP
jgi:hypothetical protein